MSIVFVKRWMRAQGIWETLFLKVLEKQTHERFAGYPRYSCHILQVCDYPAMLHPLRAFRSRLARPLRPGRVFHPRKHPAPLPTGRNAALLRPISGAYPDGGCRFRVFVVVLVLYYQLTETPAADRPVGQLQAAPQALVWRAGWPALASAPLLRWESG